MFGRSQPTGSDFTPPAERSLPVYTAKTPGSLRAALESIPLMRACACELRTKQA